MRAFCLEYGVALHQGAGIFKLELPHALKDEGNDLSPMMRRLVGDHYNDLCRLEERIRQVTREIEAERTSHAGRAYDMLIHCFVITVPEPCNRARSVR